MKASIEAQAACHGLVRLSGSMPNSMSACARRASCSVSSRATCSAVSGDRPLSTYILASSRCSVSGICRARGLEVEDRLLGVALGADRDVLAGAHAERARGQRGDAGDHDGAAVVGRAGDAHHDAGGRHDAVVGAEHGGAQPVEPRADVVAHLVVEVLGLLVGADLHAHATILARRRAPCNEGEAGLSARVSRARRCRGPRGGGAGAGPPRGARRPAPPRRPPTPDRRTHRGAGPTTVTLAGRPRRASVTCGRNRCPSTRAPARDSVERQAPASRSSASLASGSRAA